MKAHERVVKDLKRILALGKVPADIDPNAAAHEYARLCREANERLRLCGRYTAEGRLSEAMHVAESTPALLDLCAALDFEGAESWIETAAASGWETPESIEREALDQLNDAYGSAISLEPTVRCYRGAAQKKDARGCTRLLRKIMELDPGNPHWVTDLMSFEATRLVELRREYERYAQADDVAGLQSLADEIAEPWVSELGDKLKADVAAGLRRALQKEAFGRGMKIVAAISAAYAAFDYRALEDALREYDAIVAEGYFQPNEALRTQWDEAREWFENEKKRKHEDQAFDGALARLRAQLDKKVPGKGVEKAWLSVRAFDRHVPQEVESRAKHAIENYYLAEYRRKRRAVALAACAGAVLLAAALGIVWRIQYTKAKRFWAAQLDECYKKLDLEGFRQTRKDIAAYQPLLFGRFLIRSPEVCSLTRLERELEVRLRGREYAFNEARDHLDRMRAAGFREPDAEIESLLFGAGMQALSGEQRAWVQDCRTAWRDQRDRDRTGKDRQLQALMARIAEGMPSFDSIRADRLTEIESVLDAKIRLIAEGRKEEGASEEVRKTFRRYADEVEEVRAAVARMKDMVRGIREPRDLASYFAALQEYAAAYPRDPIAAKAGDLAKRRKVYEHLAAVPPIASLQSGLEDMKRIFDGMDTDNPFWLTTLGEVVELETAKRDKWPDIRKATEGLADDPALVSMFSFRAPLVGGGSVEAFFEVTSDSDVQYFGRAYSPQRGDTHATWTSRGLRKSDVKRSMKKLAHCDFVSQLVQEAKAVAPPESDVFLLNKIAALYEDGAILNALLRVKLLQFLGRQLQALVGAESIPAIAKAVKRFDDELAARQMGDSANELRLWLCVNSEEVKTACRDLDAVLKEVLEDRAFIGLYRFRVEAARACVRRGARLVGFVDIQDGTARFLSGKEPGEVWVVRQEQGGTPYVLVARERSAGGTSPGVAWAAGEPLFAPDDRATPSTGVMLKALVQSTGIGDPALIRNWPAVWPRNRRGL